MKVRQLIFGLIFFIFHSKATFGESSTPGKVIIQNDLVYGSAVNHKNESVLLKLDAYYLDNASRMRPIVVLIHGGGFGGGDKQYSEGQGDLYPKMANEFAKMGYVVFSVNYRLWPGYPPSQFSTVFEHAIADVQKSVDWIKSRYREFDIDTTKFIACGDSAGGSIAVAIAYRNRAVNPFIGCINLWGGLPPYGNKQYGIYPFPIINNVPATCTIHGSMDSIVSPQTSVDLHAKLKAVGVYSEMHTITGQGHYPYTSSDLFIPQIINFSNRIVKQKNPPQEYSDGNCFVGGLSEKDTGGKENLIHLRNAVSAMSKSRCKNVVIPKGTYYIGSEGATNAFDSLMQGKLDPRSRFRDNYVPYHVALSFTDVDSLTIDGQGSTFIYSGLIQPFSFKNSKNIVIKNLTIEWKRPLFSEGLVTSVKDNVLEIKIFEEYPVNGNEPVVSFQNYSPADGQLGGVCPFSNITSLKKVAPQTVQVKSDDAKFVAAGEIVILRHIYNYRPGFDLFNVENIEFYDVTIHSLPGMGIFATRCKDILVKRLKVFPSGRRIMSDNVDATHFISCTGTIEVDSSYFEGMGDDALNVHSYYYTVKEKVGANSLKMFVAHSNAPDEKMKDYPSKGDKIEFVRLETLLPYDSAIIDSVYFDERENESFIRLNKTLPASFNKTDLIANISRLPRLVFTNNTVRNIRGRGILVQTRNALIENNNFENCTGQGIHVNTAYPWMESAGTRNVRIVGNRFINCGMGNTTYCDAIAVVIETESSQQAVGVHKHVLIKDNLVIGGNKPAFYFSSADRVTVEHNRIINHSPAAYIRYSNNIRFVNNNFDSAKVIVGPGCKSGAITFSGHSQ